MRFRVLQWIGLVVVTVLMLRYFFTKDRQDGGVKYSRSELAYRRANHQLEVNANHCQDEVNQRTHLVMKLKVIAISEHQVLKKAAAELSADSFGQAIRLADDVKLPAALMPEKLHNTSPEIAAARSEIINCFYRDLQAGIINSGESPKFSEPSEDSILIPQNFRTERIRQAADQQFKALYGDSKYIQQTLHSAIEVMLSPGIILR